MQAFTLARRIFTELGLKRVAILRVNNRYGRSACPSFAMLRADSAIR